MVDFMPITDNDFTSDELEQVITAKPELLETITGFLTKKEYSVFNKDAFKKTQDELIERTNSELTSKIATEHEKMVEEVTGLKKTSPDEKWYEFSKRAMSTLKSAEKELTELKGKTDLSAAERERIISLEKVVADKDSEINTLKNSFQSTETQLRAENKIYGEIGKIENKFKKLPELQDAISIVREKVIDEMKKSAKFENGTMFFVGEDGKAMIKDGKFVTAADLYAEKMDKFIDKGKQQPGAGGGEEGPEGEQATPGKFKNQLEVSAYLQKKGLLAGTKDYTKEWNKLGASNLPMY